MKHLVLIILALLDQKIPHHPDVHTVRAAALARLIHTANVEIIAGERAAGARHQFGVMLPDDLVATVIKRESSFRETILGDHGTSVGLMQIHEGGRCWALAEAALGRTIARAEMLSPAFNVRAGLRCLYAVRRECGGGPPEAWISRFNGGAACGQATDYTTKVMAELARAQARAGGRLVAETP